MEVPYSILLDPEVYNVYIVIIFKYLLLFFLLLKVRAKIFLPHCYVICSTRAINIIKINPKINNFPDNFIFNFYQVDLTL